MLKGKIIGGDFELESIPSGLSEQDVFQTYGVSGTWTTSGRSALAVILQHLTNRGVNHVHLPAYLCSSILLPIKELGLTYSFYRVDHELAAHPESIEGSAVLLIHYFGWLNKSTARIREEAVHGSFHLIEDTFFETTNPDGSQNTEGILENGAPGLISNFPGRGISSIIAFAALSHRPPKYD